MQYTWECKAPAHCSGRRKDRGGGWPGVRGAPLRRLARCIDALL